MENEGLEGEKSFEDQIESDRVRMNAEYPSLKEYTDTTLDIVLLRHKALSIKHKIEPLVTAENIDIHQEHEIKIAKDSIRSISNSSSYLRRIRDEKYSTLLDSVDYEILEKYTHELKLITSKI